MYLSLGYVTLIYCVTSSVVQVVITGYQHNYLLCFISV
jgi:hypothetical protein